MENVEESKVIIIRLQPEVHHDLKQMALDNDASIQELIEDLIEYQLYGDEDEEDEEDEDE